MHIDLPKELAAVDLVEELHPHEGVVDDGVAEQPYLAMSAQPRTSDKYACTHLCDKSCRGVRKYTQRQIMQGGAQIPVVAREILALSIGLQRQAFGPLRNPERIQIITHSRQPRLTQVTVP